MSGNRNQVEPIAIIGLGCRLPGGVESPEELWKLLCDGVDAIEEVPASRWNLDTIYDPDRGRKGRSYTRHAGFIQHFDEFDAAFFGISPREAECMDPQQRWLLEVTWEALEDAAVAPDRLSGSDTGVFVGLFVRDYEQLQLSSVNRDIIDAHTGAGVSMGVAANRISYAYNLVGPSLTVDTACSSAMIALHLACQSLRNGECSMAICGGVNALLKPEFTIATSKASMLSPDGRCKSFDASANGYVRSEAVGVAVLKPLSRAIADGDPIHAVIRGSAINQDGRSAGLTVPNGVSQEVALRAALEQAGVSPREVQYAEAHGTGTPVGDPIEATAIGNVLGKWRENGSRLVMGSVKSNLGHTESAAGIVSLIKVALALKHRQLPPNLHLRNPNPGIAFDELKLRVPTSLEPWPETGGAPRRAVINSFGFGGANGSMVVEEAPPVQRAAPVMDERAMLLPLSARSPEALTALAGQYREFLNSAAAPLADMCFTAATGRAHLPHRAFVVGRSKAEMIEALDTAALSEAPDERPRLAFVYTGMGPQWWAMGRQLLAAEPVFRAAVERCDAIFRDLAGWSILAELTAGEASSKIDETRVAQPAILAIQVGLTELWRSWGIRPDAIVGHSVGEAAAAYASGALSLEDAVTVIYQRSRLQQTTAGTGVMLAVGISQAEAESLVAPLSDQVAIGAINSPASLTLAGDREALEQIAATLTAQQRFNRFLQVEVPYHSPKMDPIRDELLSSLGGLRPRAASIPLYSTVTGALIDGATLTAEYWWRNVRQPVRFADAAAALIASGHSCFLEIGPKPVLARNLNDCLQAAGAQGTTIASLRGADDERIAMLSAAGALYLNGVLPEWRAFTPGQLTPLPHYAWQRERYWMETPESRAERVGPGARRSAIAAAGATHPLLGVRLQLAPSAQVWESEIDLRRLPFLADHCVRQAVVFPAAGYIAMALAAGREALGAACSLDALQFDQALLLGDEPSRLQLTIAGGRFEIHSARAGESGVQWTRHAQGQLRRLDTGAHRESRASIEVALPYAVDPADAYGQFANLGLRYGDAFRGIAGLWLGDGEALARLRLPDPVSPQSGGYAVHPSLIDACFQTLIGTVLRANERGIYLPVQIDGLAVHVAEPMAADQELVCHARLLTHTPSQIVGEIELRDATGRLLLEVRGLLCHFQPQEREPRPFDEHLFEYRWENAPSDAAVVAATREPATWVIFADGQGVGHALAASLRAANQAPIVVERGDGFARLGPDWFRISGNNAEDYRRLLDALPPWPKCGHIVHLWSLDTPPASESLAVDLGCLSVLRLLQSLAGRTPRLWLVTRGSQSVAGERINVGQAPLWGMARVIAQEHADLRCTRLDLDPARPSDEARLLFAELAANGSEDQVAWRAGCRRVLRMSPYQHAPTRRRTEIRGDATYLITGGTGGLGVEIARRLIDLGARHLVLTSRSGSRGREAALESLRASGADVRVLVADIAKPARVLALLAEIQAAMPPLRGIVHAAGVLDDGVLLQQTPERFHAVLAPKVAGAWALHTQTLDLPLDFFVSFSSVASFAGSPGQGNYSAANAFLDALAQDRRAAGLPALSINWGPWTEVGLAAQGTILAGLAARGVKAIEPREGVDIFADLLDEPAAQIAAFAVDWPAFLANWPGAGSPFYSTMAARSAAPAQAESAFRDDLLAAAAEDQEPMLRGYLREELARALRFKSANQIKPKHRLFDLGLDSLMSLELTNRLRANLGIPLRPTLLFDFGTVEALGSHLVQQVLGPRTPEPAVVPAAPRSTPVDALDGLSESEVAELLSRALAAEA